MIAMMSGCQGRLYLIADCVSRLVIIALERAQDVNSVPLVKLKTVLNQIKQKFLIFVITKFDSHADKRKGRSDIRRFDPRYLGGRRSPPAPGAAVILRGRGRAGVRSRAAAAVGSLGQGPGACTRGSPQGQGLCARAYLQVGPWAQAPVFHQVKQRTWPGPRVPLVPPARRDPVPGSRKDWAGFTVLSAALAAKLPYA